MKLGVVRRIDDLGRIVIPKEIRNMLGIEVGDGLEIFPAKDNDGNASIILQKQKTEPIINEKLETLLYKTIIAWFDEVQYIDYNSIDEQGWIEYVCSEIGITEEEYKKIMKLN